ncbi:MAG: FKBP-type peptidyl-prolyl cis-trans isomerase [Spirosomataceae bacterium]
MLKNTLLLVCGVAILSSCDQFKVKTEDGVKFQIHEEGKGTKTPKDGDLITFHLVIKTPNDTTVKSTYREGNPITFPIQKGSFKGSFENGLYKLSEGDSATIYVSADSLYSRVQQPLPPGTPKGSDLRFIVKLIKIQSREDYTHAVNERKTKEAELMDAYAKKNFAGATKTASGIYYVVNKAGAGPNATAGDTVVVNYTGKLMDGKTFDSSIGREPFVFPLGQNMVIPGWEQALSMMKKGEKATVFIPSSLAYGEAGAGGVIEPYTPLIFEIELLDIKGKK